MDVPRITALIDLVAQADISELTIADPEGEIHIARYFGATTASVPHSRPQPVSMAAEPSAATADAHHVNAPMVGTFHRSAKAETAPLIDVGAVVEVGTPLCVIEAMKIMNEIAADKAGKVTRILCEDGQAVELDQPLFVIE